MNRRGFMAATAAAMALPRLARGAAHRTYGGTLVAAILDKGPATMGDANPRTLDPHRARTLLERELAAALHATLLFAPHTGISHRRPGPLVDALALSPKDARVWTLTLRRDLVFADGAPIDAAAVAASLSRTLSLPGGRALAISLSAARARDALTVEIETPVPMRDLAPLLSTTASAIVSTRGNADPFWGPAGAGGFLPGTVSSSSIPGLTLVANPRAALGRAFADKLSLVPALEGADAAAALRKGAVHVTRGTGSAPPRELVRGDAVSTFALVVSPRLSADLRHRIAGAPARHVLCQQFLPHRAEPAVTLLPAAHYGPLVGAVPPDRPRVPKLSPPFRARLAAADVSREMGEVAERLVWDLLEVGIEAKRVYRAPDALEAHAAKELWELMLVEIAPEDRDAGRAIAALASDPLVGPSMGEAALESARTALLELADPDARTTAARAIDEKARDGGLVIPIVHPRRLLRRSDRVEGLPSVLPDGRVDWAEAGVRAERGRTP